jgi:RNase P/RNase MRP subunit POP5
MRIFVDESGSFGWVPTGRSVFCAITVADRAYEKLGERFGHWRNALHRLLRNREVKGSNLTDLELEAFAGQVVVSNSDLWLTVVAVDTRVTNRNIVETCVRQASEVVGAASCIFERNARTNIAVFYRQMSGWVKRRSPENYLWTVALQKTILAALQNSIARFLEPEDAPEFENIEILIDQSYIHRPEHIAFWTEWLRNLLFDATPLMVPKEWASEANPFVRKYPKSGNARDFSDLYRNHVRFSRSAEVLGLQVADVCANICYRHHASSPNLTAYRLIEPRMVGQGGRTVTVLQIDERSLHPDEPERHVHLLN